MMNTMHFSSADRGLGLAPYSERDGVRERGRDRAIQAELGDKA